MFSSSASTPGDRLSPLSAASRSHSPESDDERSSKHSGDSKQNAFYLAKHVMPQSSSPESEDIPESQKFSSSKNATRSWKVKISTHVAPPEQEERYVRTRERVSDIVQKILGYGSNAAQDVLEIGASVLQFAPIGGLAPAAQTLVIIWNALELVESNQLACLSLTERCADTLIVLREEINGAGEDIEKQLQFPLMQLNESFNAVKTLLQAQAHRPFFKRYLKRKEIQGQIEACDAKLSNALDLFSVMFQMNLTLKIQIRSFQRMEAAEAKRRAGEVRTRQDLKQLLASLPAKMRQPETLSLSQVMTVAETEPSPGDSEPVSSDRSISEDSTALTALQSRVANLSTASEVRKMLDDLVMKKNNRDFVLDLVELRNLMREALEKSSDEALLEVLQVSRGEVREVLEELQRALEEYKESNDNSEARSEPRDVNSDISSKPEKEPTRGILRAKTMPTKLYEQEISDELDREFIQCAIKALKRSNTI